MTTTKHPFTHFTALAGLLAALAGAAGPAAAQTLTFDGLPAPPGAAGDAPLPDANGGSRTLDGVTFNANAVAGTDWEVIGRDYHAPLSSDPFLQTHSGLYALAGNAFEGGDGAGGLTLTTTGALTGLWVSADDNGLGSYDAQSVTITALGASGALAALTIPLDSTTPIFEDAAATFGGLSGIQGYRFTAAASNALYAAAGQAYVVADDLTFAPVPEGSSAWPLGLGLLLLGAPLRRARRRTGA
jgi:hypothetical protein